MVPNPVSQATVTNQPLIEREAALKRLADEEWDIVVIGGGIVGSGVLLDATSRGLKAALIEQDDLAVGTSSRSSRLIHGGLRYLEDLRLHLVREALLERSRLMRLAPHLVRLERFLFPVYGWPLFSRAFMGAGLTLYDLLGAARDGGRAHHLGSDAVAELVPSIRREGLRGGVTYSDGVEDDARYSITVARTAVDQGATAVTRTRVTDLLTADDGRVIGVKATDLLGDAELEVRANKVIDATGVWLGHPEARLGGSTMKLAPSRGTHLVFERDRLPLKAGMTLKIPGRVLFLIPYPGAWIVGTTDEADDGAPDRPVPTLDEVDQILENVNHVLDVDLKREDAVGAFTGLRPLVGVPGGDTARVSREHTIHREDSGLVRASGGKYTTYRLMARDAVDVALEDRGESIPRSRTADLELLGAAPREELDRLVSELATSSGIGNDRVRSLVDRHGTQARDVLDLGRQLDLLRPLADDVLQLEVEVAWAVSHEMALSLDDVLSRRMRLSTARRDRGAGVAPRAARIMGDQLGWDTERQAAEVETYLASAHREFDVPGTQGSS
ncbi:MAG: glycerol-3-phosphate dehydrogenase [Planctomycetota bacterium]|nr:MAG: glycerol-3-phosphate dehydrogenase [Planctomycetota bacterium]